MNSNILKKITPTMLNKFTKNFSVIPSSNWISNLYEHTLWIDNNNSIGASLRNINRNNNLSELKVENIILDFSGTCVDAFTLAPAIAFVEVFKKYNINICIENAVKKPMGLYKREHIKYILNMDDVKKQWFKEYNRESTEDDLNNIYKDFIKLQIDVLPEYCKPLPKVVETMEFLRNTGIKFGGCSGFSREMINTILENTKDKGLYFESTFLADDIKDKNKIFLGGRPYPFMIYENLFKLENKNISQCIKVDDSAVGIEEGLAANCWTIGISNYSNYINVNSLEEYSQMSELEKRERKDNSKKKLAESGCHYVIGEFEELIYVVDDINHRLKNGERP